MYSRNSTEIRTMKEKTNRTAKQDLKALVTILTMYEDDEQDRHILEFTRKELMIAITVSRNNSADSKGIKAYDIKGADEETTTMIHEIFNLIIKKKNPKLPTHGIR